MIIDLLINHIIILYNSEEEIPLPPDFKSIKKSKDAKHENFTLQDVDSAMRVGNNAMELRLLYI
jgi:hypothetical protein